MACRIVILDIGDLFSREAAEVGVGVEDIYVVAYGATPAAFIEAWQLHSLEHLKNLRIVH